MSNLHFEKSRHNKKFWAQKGFYLVMALCLVAVGATAWGVFGNSGLTELPEASSSEPIVVDWGVSQPVENPVSDVPVESSQAPVEPSEPEESEPVEQTNTPVPETYMYPAGNEVMNHFSGDTLVYSQTLEDWRVHDGMDLQAEKGSEVKAIADGTVLSSTDDPLWGKVLEVDHGNGLVACYRGLAENNSLKKGDTVQIGQVIGAIGSIPCEVAEAPHLHLTITKDGEAVDPATILGE